MYQTFVLMKISLFQCLHSQKNPSEKDSSVQRSAARLQKLAEVSFEIRLKSFIPEHRSRVVSNIICSRSRRFQIDAERAVSYLI